MHFNFNFVLVFAVSLTSAALADRDYEHRPPQLLDVVERHNDASSDSSPIPSNWAGVVITPLAPIVGSVTGTFQAPFLSGNNDSTIGVMIGIDGGALTPCTAFLVAGVECTVISSETTCQAIVEWAPNPPKLFSDVKVSPGDSIRVNATVLQDGTSGYVTIQNSRTRKEQILEFRSQPQLCQMTGEWFVTTVANWDYLANFSSVTFTNTVVYSEFDQDFTPVSEWTHTYVIQKDGVSVTSVYPDQNSVTVKYV